MPTAPPPNDSETAFLSAPGRQTFAVPPRVLIIGAGSRGTAYAKAALASTNSTIAAIAEPLPYKRTEFGQKFIWGADGPKPEQQFEHWRQWVKYEEARRAREKAGEKVERGVDAVFVCVLDEMHEEVVCGIAGLGVHVCCEKPLATSLKSCVAIWRALKGAAGGDGGAVVDGEKRREAVFGICHVLRYSPHNMLLRQLVLEKDVIGDVLSIEHVEPVGHWHFSHSYVRGNWRKESTTAPSLLTKSCHDIDFLMWMLCSPPPNGVEPHLPSFLTSTGSRKFFRKERKPEAAKDSTNCLSCPHEKDCEYSAKRVYLDKQLDFGNTGWPVKIVNPEIEELYKTSGKEAAVEQLLSDLREDYTSETPVNEVEARPWFGRCVYEADNDVCDDQCVTITWDDDPLIKDGGSTRSLQGRGAKTAQFHMVAFTEKICERRGRIYGTKGEIEYDSATIKVHSFATGYTKVHKPHIAQGGHGGGDEGLARQFLMAVEAVDSRGMSAAEAQREFLGCDLDEAFRSHAVVFAAEEARKERKVVDWKTWWDGQVEPQLHQRQRPLERLNGALPGELDVGA
ncbi:streptomycin biosynthesis protein StrI [Melanomma pulvis-pyrius CBS 109.77]|uniref:Streptomycin biosynthesis protein StrI n=1 Tax=Melanomma pulvis-pyrius CBS 109.77 TaxID=1314802 RepID=A0A6A6XMC7_9PLEO|nr:streptomycin biosynthesis protein StrI [Melanomma pulvis-pyrius CBS 109.77]